jgi:hypothetical protein
VTLVAIAALALAAAPEGASRAWIDPPRWGRWTRAVPAARAEPARTLALAVVSALLAVSVAASAALPAISESNRLSAQIKAADATNTAATEDALSEALLAHKLNPLDVESLFVAADIERRLGREARATDLIVDAAEIQPDNYRVWERVVDTKRTDLISVAVRKLSEREPLTIALNLTSARGTSFVWRIPPYLSPTAFATPAEKPLPPAQGPASTPG